MMATTNTISPTRRLTRKQAERIRTVYADPKSNLSQRDLAKQYRVARSTIYNIIHRVTYDDGPLGAPADRQARARDRRRAAARGRR